MDNLCFYSYSYNHDKACKMSTKTWKRLLKDKLYSITVRTAIPAPKKYYNIAICEENLPLVDIPFLFEHAAYIVSPFAPNPNFETLFHPLKEKFIDGIISTPEFNCLAAYVFEHRIDRTPCTKEDIIEAYKQLLSEFYDTTHEADDSEVDAKGE